MNEHEAQLNSWYELFERKIALSSEPMADDVSHLFIALCLGENKKRFTVPDELTDSFLFKMLTKRAEFIGVRLHQSTAFFLSCICSTPGDAVMYLTFLRMYMHKQNASDAFVDMHRLTHIFPIGFLSKAALDELWIFQKVEGANLLDMVKFE